MAVYYPGGRLFNEAQIFAEVSAPLRQQLSMHACGPVLTTLGILEERRDASGQVLDYKPRTIPNASEETARQDARRVADLADAVALVLRRVVFLAGDYIIRQHQTRATGMVFIHRGSVQVCRSSSHASATELGDGTTSSESDDSKKEKVVAELGPGQFFGEVGLLMEHSHASASVRVPEVCEGYELSREAFIEVCREFPEFKHFVRQVAKDREAKNAHMELTHTGSTLKRQPTNIQGAKMFSRTQQSRRPSEFPPAKSPAQVELTRTSSSRRKSSQTSSKCASGLRGRLFGWTSGQSSGQAVQRADSDDSQLDGSDDYMFRGSMATGGRR